MLTAPTTPTAPGSVEESADPRARARRSELRMGVILGIALASAFSGIEPKVGVVTLRPLDVVALLVVGLGMARLLITNRVRRYQFPSAVWIFAAYLVYRAAVALLLSGVAVGLKEGIQAIELIPITALVAVYTTKPDVRRSFLISFAATVGIIAVYVSVASILAGSLFSFKRFDEASITPGLFATLCVGFRASHVASAYARRLSTVALLASGVLAVMSGARASWLGFVIAAILVSRARATGLSRGGHGRRRHLQLGLFLIVAPTLLLGGVLVATRTGDAYFARQTRSLLSLPRSVLTGEPAQGDLKVGDSDRIVNLELGWQAFLENPLTGIGPDNFRDYIHEAAASRGARAYQPHNEFLLAASELGLMGLLLYLGAFALTGRYYVLPWYVRRYRYSLGFQIGVALFGFGLVLNGLFGGGAVNYVFLIVPMGLAVGILREQRQESQRAHDTRRPSPQLVTLRNGESSREMPPGAPGRVERIWDG